MKNFRTRGAALPLRYYRWVTELLRYYRCVIELLHILKTSIKVSFVTHYPMKGVVLNKDNCSSSRKIKTAFSVQFCPVNRGDSVVLIDVKSFRRKSCQIEINVEMQFPESNIVLWRMRSISDRIRNLAYDKCNNYPISIKTAKLLARSTNRPIQRQFSRHVWFPATPISASRATCSLQTPQRPGLADDKVQSKIV